MTTELLLTKLQDARTDSDSLVYHALQPDLTIKILHHGGLIATAGDFVIGGPVTEPETLRAELEQLVQSQPQLAFAHIQRTVAEILKTLGHSILRLGEEARVPLPFNLTGKSKADLRREINRSRRAGVIVRELSTEKFAEIAKIIESKNCDWLLSRKCFKREFRFLARPYRRSFAPGERRFIAFLDNSPVGLAIYDPVYENGETVGYLEAITRPYLSAPAGVRDHLTLTAIDKFSEEKFSFLSLGLCPFHNETKSEFSENSTISDLLLQQFYRFGGGIFNCSGLAFHKKRYRPILIPVYFSTRSPFPAFDLYRICRASNIDPLAGLVDSLRNFLSAIVMSQSVLIHYPTSQTR